MIARRFLFWNIGICYLCFAIAAATSQDLVVTKFGQSVKPFLNKYCAECHQGEDANADIDFAAIQTEKQIADSYEIWEACFEQLTSRTMPPEDKPQPTQAEVEQFSKWYQGFVSQIEPRPAPFQPRRLSVNEFRNTLRSLLGFDLEVAIIEAEQTVAEKSMVIKLLPIDPPGESGFKNDTHKNLLSLKVWEQYSNLIDLALEEFFSPERRSNLQSFVGLMKGKYLSPAEAETLVRKFVTLAWRRPVDSDVISAINERLGKLSHQKLEDALKTELKSVLLSPSFLFRGLRTELEPGKRQPVDAFELAERLSYFIWADMPDQELHQKALDGSLLKQKVIASEIDRMLKSPKSKALAEIFATEWFTLNEIEKLSNNPPQMIALKSQPLDFMNYLFTEKRPLLELVDSDVAFVNPFTARNYGKDSKQMTRYVKQRGIEVEIVPNQKIQLIETKVRGGILTMPGILAMNKGPIIRGTWVLERILGDHLPEPPPNVGQVPRNRSGEKLTFRQRFELHRSNPTCAVCHDKIDPVGFALEGFNSGGSYVLKNYKPTKKELKRGAKVPDQNSIDTSGELPTGEKFTGIEELKKILVTTQKTKVVRNIVKRTMSYAFCRKLKVHDQPTVESITKRMEQTDGTWRDLFIAVATSPQFLETISGSPEK